MNKKLTSSLFKSLITLLFVTNSIFLLSTISSFLLRFVEGIMRSYNWSNQHKHFSKSNIMNLPLFSMTEKIYPIFYDTNNYKNGNYNSCTASVFNETYNFRREYSFLIFRKKGRKNWIRTIILATQNSINKSNVFNW